jgi:hypothetical protein
MKKYTNEILDKIRREALDLPEWDEKHDEYRSFSNADGKTLKKLLDAGAVDPNDRQNSSPTAGEFIEYCVNHPGAVCGGYLIGPARSDCRLSIDTIDEDTDKSQTMDFVKMFRDADEFFVDDDALERGYVHCHAWYD